MPENAQITNGILHREIARAGIWISSGKPLTQPIRAEGLSSTTISNGELKVTPDIDVLSWLCAHWLREQPADGVINPTFFHIARDLYGSQSGKAYELIDESLERLGRTTIEFEFTDPKRSADTFKAGGSIIHYVKPRWKRGGEYQKAAISLNLGMRQGILNKEVVNLDWTILREFHGRQQLAKRLWCYLQAEKWRTLGGETETTFMALGDRFYTALGLGHVEPRFARRKITQACRAIYDADPRYLCTDAGLAFAKEHNQTILRATRPTSTRWKKERTSVILRRAEIRDAAGRKRR